MSVLPGLGCPGDNNKMANILIFSFRFKFKKSSFVIGSGKRDMFAHIFKNELLA